MKVMAVDGHYIVFDGEEWKCRKCDETSVTVDGTYDFSRCRGEK